MRGERVTLDTIDQGLRNESLAVLPKRSSTAQTIFRILIACTVIASLLLTGMCIGAIGSDGGTWMYNTSSEVDAGSRVRVDTVISIAGTPTVDLSAINGDIHATTGPPVQVKDQWLAPWVARESTSL